MKVVCIADSHGFHDQIKVPDGDLLIHAGDFSMLGKPPEVAEFKEWFDGLPHKEKVVICGNHERGLEGLPSDAISDRVTSRSSTHYLHGTSVMISSPNGKPYRLWGGPWQPAFMDWAYNVPRGKLAFFWQAIPDDVEILITHGPPQGILDKVRYIYEGEVGDHVGCEQLAERIKDLKLLKLNVFGHIHEAHGMEEVNGVKYVNASICNLQYQPINPPIVVDL